jgi:hypothetical protein
LPLVELATIGEKFSFEPVLFPFFVGPPEVYD